MYVILTSKPGIYHTESGPDATVLEAYEYRLNGVVQAVFRIATLQAGTRLRIVEDTPPNVVNEVPAKFLAQFDSLDAARQELHHLTRFGHLDASLVPCGGGHAVQ